MKPSNSKTSSYKTKFDEGEKVLCYHGPLIYEAKCLKSTVTKDKQVKYFVHYAGWSKSWDEWVPESRVLKYNDENVAKQKEILKRAPVKGKKTKAKIKTEPTNTKVSDTRASTPVQDSGPEVTNTNSSARKTSKAKQPSTSLASASDLAQTTEQPKKKRRAESIIEPETDFVCKVEINIKIPDDLKLMLTDDWEMIYKHKNLWTLPAKLTVHDILENFVTYSQSGANKFSNVQIKSESSIMEVANGIKEYFNAVLNTQLLYKLERPQFNDLINDDDDLLPSQVYGGYHLLRLFVGLGTNLSFTLMDDNNIQFLVVCVQDLLKYLSSNIDTVFNLDNHCPTSDYFKKVV